MASKRAAVSASLRTAMPTWLMLSMSGAFMRRLVVYGVV
jgi:hypothetical protein